MNCEYLLNSAKLIFDLPPSVQFFLIFFSALVFFLAVPKAVLYFYCLQHNQRTQLSADVSSKKDVSIKEKLSQKLQDRQDHLLNVDADSFQSSSSESKISAETSQSSSENRSILNFCLDKSDEQVLKINDFEKDVSSQFERNSVKANEKDEVRNNETARDQTKDVDNVCLVCQEIVEELLTLAADGSDSKNISVCSVPGDQTQDSVSNLLCREIVDNLVTFATNDFERQKSYEDSAQYLTSQEEEGNLHTAYNRYYVDDFMDENQNIENDFKEDDNKKIDSILELEQSDLPAKDMLNTIEFPQFASYLSGTTKVQRAAINEIKLDNQEMRIVQQIGDLCREIDVNAFLNANTSKSTVPADQTQNILSRPGEKNIDAANNTDIPPSEGAVPNVNSQSLIDDLPKYKIESSSNEAIKKDAEENLDLEFCKYVETVKIICCENLCQEIVDDVLLIAENEIINTDVLMQDADEDQIRSNDEEDDSEGGSLGSKEGEINVLEFSLVDQESLIDRVFQESNLQDLHRKKSTKNSDVCECLEGYENAEKIPLVRRDKNISVSCQQLVDDVLTVAENELVDEQEPGSAVCQLVFCDSCQQLLDDIPSVEEIPLVCSNKNIQNSCQQLVDDVLTVTENELVNEQDPERAVNQLLSSDSNQRLVDDVHHTVTENELVDEQEPGNAVSEMVFCGSCQQLLDDVLSVEEIPLDCSEKLKESCQQLIDAVLKATANELADEKEPEDTAGQLVYRGLSQQLLDDVLAEQEIPLVTDKNTNSCQELVDDVLTLAENELADEQVKITAGQRVCSDASQQLVDDVLSVQEIPLVTDKNIDPCHQLVDDVLAVAENELLDEQEAESALEDNDSLLDDEDLWRKRRESQISLEVDLLEKKNDLVVGWLNVSFPDEELARSEDVQESAESGELQVEQNIGDMCRDIVVDCLTMVENQLMRMHSETTQEQQENVEGEEKGDRDVSRHTPLEVTWSAKNTAHWSALETVGLNEDLILSHTLREIVEDEADVMDKMLDDYTAREPFVNCLPRFLVEHVGNANDDLEGKKSDSSMETELYCLDSFDTEEDEPNLLRHRDSMDLLCTRRSCDHAKTTSLINLRSSVEILLDKTGASSRNGHQEDGNILVGHRDSIDVLCMRIRNSSEELCTSGRPLSFGNTPPKSILKMKKSSHSRSVSWKDLQEREGSCDSATILVSDHHDLGEKSESLIRVFNGKFKECQSICDETELSAWWAKDANREGSLSNILANDDGRADGDEEYFNQNKSMTFWKNVNIDKTTDRGSRTSSNKSFEVATETESRHDEIVATTSETKVNEKSRTSITSVDENQTTISLNTNKNLPSKSCLKVKRAEKICKSEPMMKPVVHKVTLKSTGFMSGSWGPSSIPRCDDDESLNNLSEKLLEISEKFYAKKYEDEKPGSSDPKIEKPSEQSGPKDRLSILERYFVTILTDEQIKADEKKQT